MKPLIGITSSMGSEEIIHRVNAVDVNAIVRAGGVPMILPNLTANEDIKRLAKQIDGLYAIGGYDVNPHLYGEEPHKDLGTVTPMRDHFEIAITKEILHLEKPFLGVCRGAQILNIVTGGTLYQDMYAQVDRELIQHSQKSITAYGTHYIDVKKDSLLYRLTESEKILVNSKHHQSCKDVLTPLQVSGTTSDQIIEAIESNEHPFVLGVQWHPEYMVVENDIPSIAIFEGFINACK